MPEGMMKSPKYLFPAALVAVAFSGCGDPYRQVTTDYRDTWRELVTVLQACTDEPSAKAAVPRLEALRERFLRISGRAGDLDPPNAAQRAAISEILAADATLADDHVKVQRRLLRQGPEWPIIKNALNGVKEAMEKARDSIIH
jgi:hypothetical protein